MAGDTHPSLFVLGSRRRDAFLAGAILAFLLAGSFVMRVYYRITVYAIDAVAVAADGTRTPVATPERIAGLNLWHLPPAQVLSALDVHLRRLHRRDPWRRSIEEGTRFEWTVRYSFNSTDLDRRRVLTYPRGTLERR